MHGKTSQNKILFAPTPIFKDIPEQFIATRYHSLVVDKQTLPDVIEPTALSDDDGQIMALQNQRKTYLWCAVSP